MKKLRKISAAGFISSAICLSAHAQGILTITPGRVAGTTAGTGISGYTAEATQASNAALASPSSIAYDASGNLYIADTNNHVVRELVKSNGTIITIAGTGVAGFSGDGETATTAQLDTPTGVALDGKGTLYIADSHNHRIRQVVNGVITTSVGTGTPGFFGDGGQASAAQLALPSAVAVDTTGRLLIADTNNQRIRAVTKGVITTVVGNGEELFAGDGGAATAASLDQPTGLAIDASGNLYIADKHNQRIRMVNAAGVISTFAGNGASSFAGDFSGDGGVATAATLARPVSVSVNSNGVVLITDTNNQRIRQVTAGVIATVAGSGEQGFAGDGGPLLSAALNAPHSATADPTGTLFIADTLNQRLRVSALPSLDFPRTAVGIASAAQNLMLANTGVADLTVTQVSLSGAFAITTDGSCTGLPFTLAPGASCTQSVVFTPTSTGVAAGSVTITGTGLVPQSVSLAGTGVEGTSTTTLTANTASALMGQAVTFLATVQPSSGGAVTFYDGANQIGTTQALVNNTASLTVSNLAAGPHSITAAYSGGMGVAGSRSGTFSELIGDFDFTISSGNQGTSTAGDGTTGSANQAVMPGQPVTYTFNVKPLAGPFNFPVTLSATGLPPGATVTFSPQVITLGAAPASFTMTVHTALATARLNRVQQYGGGTFAFALMLLPLSGAVRRRTLQSGPLALCLVLLGTGVAMATLTGCGVGNGFFGVPEKTYTIQVIGTARNTSGSTLQHVANVQLTLQ